MGASPSSLSSPAKIVQLSVPLTQGPVYPHGSQTTMSPTAFSMTPSSTSAAAPNPSASPASAASQPLSAASQPPSVLPPGGTFFPVMPAPTSLPSVQQQQQIFQHHQHQLQMQQQHQQGQHLPYYLSSGSSPVMHQYQHVSPAQIIQAHVSPPSSNAPKSPLMSTQPHFHPSSPVLHHQQQQHYIPPFPHPQQYQLQQLPQFQHQQLHQQLQQQQQQLQQMYRPQGHQPQPQVQPQRHSPVMHQVKEAPASGGSSKRAAASHMESPKPAKAQKSHAKEPPPPAAADDDEDGDDYQVVDGAHDDEYRWRKYGQKIMKGSPYPRSYYKCTTPNCQAKKLVESVMKDGKEITVASFRGTHTHPAPGSRKMGGPAPPRSEDHSAAEDEPAADGHSHAHGKPHEHSKDASSGDEQGKLPQRSRRPNAKKVFTASSAEEESDDDYTGGRSKPKTPAKKGRGRKPKKTLSEEGEQEENDEGEVSYA